MSEDIGYIKGKVEGIEKSIDNITETHDKLFGKMNTVEGLIRDLPCQDHANKIKQLQGETSANRARSHGAASAAEEISVKVRPIIEKMEAAEIEETKTEERRWYQRMEIRIGITVGIIVGIFNFLPGIITFVKNIFN